MHRTTYGWQRTEYNHLQVKKATTNKGISRAMELLNSIKKQRELFSQTLSTAQMPTHMGLHQTVENDDAARQGNLNPVAETARKPLSPRNKKAGVNDARELVSCLRSKREDLIKRFEKANLTNKPDTCTVSLKNVDNSDQENNLGMGKKTVVDLSELEQTNVPQETTFKSKQRKSLGFEKNAESKSVAKTLKTAAPVVNSLKTTAPETRLFGDVQLKKVSESTRSTYENKIPRKEPTIPGISAGSNLVLISNKKVGQPSWIKQPEDNAAPDISKETNAHTKSKQNLDSSNQSIDVETTGTRRSRGMDARNDGSDNEIKTLSATTTVDDTSWIKKTDISTEQEQSDQPCRKSDAVDSLWIKKEKKAAIDTCAHQPSLVEMAKTKYDNGHCNTEDTGLRRNPIGLPSASSIAAGIGDRKAIFEPTWTIRKEEQQKETAVAIKRNVMLDGPFERKQHHERRKSAPTVSWIKKEEEAEGPTANVDKKTNDSLEEEDAPGLKSPIVTKSWMRPKTAQHSEVQQKTMGKLKPVNDVSWIKKEDENPREHVEVMTKQKSAPSDFSCRKEPFLEPPQLSCKTFAANPSTLKHEEESNETSEKTLANKRKAEGGSKRICVSSNRGLPTPEWLRSPRPAPINKNSQAEPTIDPSQDGASSSHDEPHLLALRAKVSLFDKIVPSPVQQKTNGIPAKRRSRYFWEISETSSTLSQRRSSSIGPPKNSKISSLIQTMEKISLGENPDETTDANIEHQVVGEAGAEVQESSSADPSADEHEYGDANFSFSDNYRGCEDANQSECTFNYDDVSEGSTFKVDNYQKDFNASIPIQSPWMHPVEIFDESYSAEITTMKIVSIAPSDSYRGQSINRHDSNPDSSSFQETYSEPRMSLNLATRRTYHQVARHSLLSSANVAQSIETDVDHNKCVASGDDVDPIFQVSDYDPEHKTARGFINFLSKPRESERTSEQEEIKSGKGMFSILKKGLVGSSSGKKESVVQENEEEAQGDSVDEVCSNTRTTISSITRSITSHPGENSSQKSADSKVSMPLGVLNGFFKAARKLQKRKRKTKSDRGRSLSNHRPPPFEKREASFRSYPAKVSAQPPSEVQLWPTSADASSVLNSESLPPAMAANLNRRFGAYGGLASSRSKALDASSVAIQSLASW